MATTTETHEIGNTEEVAARKLVARGRVGRRVGPGPGRLAAPTCTLKTVRTRKDTVSSAAFRYIRSRRYTRSSPRVDESHERRVSCLLICVAVCALPASRSHQLHLRFIRNRIRPAGSRRPAPGLFLNRFIFKVRRRPCRQEMWTSATAASSRSTIHGSRCAAVPRPAVRARPPRMPASPRPKPRPPRPPGSVSRRASPRAAAPCSAVELG